MQNNNEDQFWVYIAISLALHLLVYIIFSYGLPALFKSPEAPQVVTFEVVPIDTISNIKTQKVQRDKEIEEESAKKVQKTKEEIVEEKKDEKDKSDENQKESKRDFDEKKPDDKRELVSMKSAEDKKKDEKKKSDKAQEKKVKEIPKPKKKKIPTEKEMESLLKTLEKESEGKEQKSAKRSVSAKSDAKEDSIGEYNEDKPLSITEQHAIRQQIERNWNIPSGVQNAGEIVITLSISLKIDGTLDQVQLVDTKCPSGADVVCRAASDSAIRAVKQASPFQNLPAERHDNWKAFIISFTPADVLGM